MSKKVQSTSYITSTRKKKEEVELISVVILSGNHNNKMKTIGPKSMFKIMDKPLIHYQLLALNKVFPKIETILVVGFDADKIIRHRPENTRIIENQLYEDTNEVEQIRLALNNVMTDKVLIINGDIFFDSSVINGIDVKKSYVLVDKLGKMPEDSIGVTIVDGKLTAMGYGLPYKWCHICYLTNDVLKSLKQLCYNREKNRMYLSELLNIIAEKHKIEILEVCSSINRIISQKELTRINENTHR